MELTMCRLVTAFLGVLLLLCSTCTAGRNDTWAEYLKGLNDETEIYSSTFSHVLRDDDTFTIMRSQGGYFIYGNLTDARPVAWRLQEAFTKDRKTENLTDVRLSMLESTAYIFGLMSHVAKQLYKPFGPAECRLLSDDAYDRNALPSVSETPDRISRGLERIRNAVCNGTYVAGESSLDDIVDACKSFKFPERLRAIMGTGCKEGANSTVDGCLLVAVAKYTNNSRQARVDLEYAFGKYAYIAVHVKSFCFEFVEDNATNKTGELFKEISDYVNDLSIGIQTIDIPRRRDAYRNCWSVSVHLELPLYCSATYPTDVDTIANAQYEAITDKLTKHGWTGRQELHKQIVDNTVGNLSAKFGYRYTFYALAFLPFKQESQQCVGSIPRPVDSSLISSLIDVSQANLNFFVRQVPKADDRSKLNNTWRAINSTRSAILDSLFDDRSEKMCKRLARVLYDNAGVDFEKTDSGVGAFAAIKCGYHFVWYELAYIYFPAAATNSPYTFGSDGNGRYDANCGQIILFP